MSDRELKSSVRNYWQAAPCGTPDVIDLEEERRLIELERIRDEREPFIADFARFSDWKDRDILEVGCGTGTDLLRFARAGARCSAIDLTAAGVELAGKRLLAEGFAANLRVGDAERLPFDDESFDFAFSWGVIHHTPDTEAAAREILRVVRPGGGFCVMVYNRHSLLAAQAWLYFAAARGQFARSIAGVLASHVESPGTKAYTRGEAARLFAGGENVRVTTRVTPYDLRIGRRRFLPKWTHALVPAQLGWFHIITGKRS